MVTSREEGMKEGIEEGKKEMAKAIAKELKKNDVSFDLIIKTTGLSERRITKF